MLHVSDMSAKELVLQPYMLEPHPGYRAQLAILPDISPSVRVNPAFPEGMPEHARWIERGARIHRMRTHLSMLVRRYARRGVNPTCHYFAGAFSPRMHFLLKADQRIHIDADDPINLYTGVTRNRVDEVHCGIIALKLLQAVERGTLTLSFWTEVQLRNFLANFRPWESRLWFEKEAVKVIPPCISPWPMQVKIGEAEVLRCLIVANMKFWHKGVGDAITAVHRAVEQGCPVRLTLVEEDIPDAWRRFMMARPYYEVLGRRLSREELNEVFLRHDLILFPSHHDTYGWVLVEGKARGLPAIVTDFYTRPEIVTHEVDGLVVRDPFNNPFLPLPRSPYAGGFLEPDGQDGIYVHPVIEWYVEMLVSALVRCHTDRGLLRGMGANAYGSTSVWGHFGQGRRLAALREILRLSD